MTAATTTTRSSAPKTKKKSPQSPSILKQLLRVFLGVTLWVWFLALKTMVGLALKTLGVIRTTERMLEEGEEQDKEQEQLNQEQQQEDEMLLQAEKKEEEESLMPLVPPEQNSNSRGAAGTVVKLKLRNSLRKRKEQVRYKRGLLIRPS